MTDVTRSSSKISSRLGLCCRRRRWFGFYAGCPDPSTTTDGGVTKDFAGTVVDMAQNPDGGPVVQPVGCSVSAWCWQFRCHKATARRPPGDRALPDVWAVGGAGTIIHHDGSKWSMVRSPTNNALYAIWGSSANNVFASVIAGRCCVLTDQPGRRFRWGTDGAQVAQLYGVWGFDSSEVWFVGNHRPPARRCSSGWQPGDARDSTIGCIQRSARHLGHQQVQRSMPRARPAPGSGGTAPRGPSSVR